VISKELKGGNTYGGENMTHKVRKSRKNRGEGRNYERNEEEKGGATGVNKKRQVKVLLTEERERKGT